jgi:pimeloyl-ACP methyl ester carboxylesterase
LAERLQVEPFTLAGEAAIAGEEVGSGAPVVLLHGLTATRRFVLHGSVKLARRGFKLVLYDARGHGDSDPAPAGEGYGYPALVTDLRRVLEERCRGEAPVLAGHSMGAHTAIALALERSVELAGLVLICPASLGEPLPDEAAGEWDQLAEGMERGGVEGFLEAYDQGLDPEWRQTLVRIARERLGRHRHPEAVAAALREVPRSLPFDGLAELEFVDVPTLVVASRDEADPGHPYAIAEAWSERIPGAELVSEEPGQSPLAWQGGRLSRAIADFLGRAA